MRKDKAGFALLLLALALILFFVFVVNIYDADKLTACSEEAKVCDDGTIVVRVGETCEFEECPNLDQKGQVFCNDDQRNVGACIEIYQPVCGWNDPEKIKCFAYPCAQTYSNSCFACQDENVEFWTEGECPSQGS